MGPLSPSERDHYAHRWRGTIWEYLEGYEWKPLAGTGPVVRVVISAWNPTGRRLPDAVNRARDQVLLNEVTALGLSSTRARGRSADGGWSEDGWLIDHSLPRTTQLLVRYGQIAGWITGPDGPSYYWAGEATR